MDVAEKRANVRSLLNSLSNEVIPAVAGDRIMHGPVPGDVVIEPSTRGITHLSDLAAERRIRLDERDHIARELHDSTSQLLVALHLQVTRLKQMSDTKGLDGFSGAVSEIETIVTGLHESVQALAESDGSDPQLLAAELAAMAAGFEIQTGITVHTSIGELPAGMLAAVARAFYRVGQEALANACRHGKAREARLSLVGQGRSIILSVVDDGVGFAAPTNARFAGRGIANMRARMAELGGTLTIRKLPVGTMVEARIDVRP